MPDEADAESGGERFPRRQPLLMQRPRVLTVSARPLEIAYSQADARLGLFLTHRLSIARDSSKERSHEEEGGRGWYAYTSALVLGRTREDPLAASDVHGGARVREGTRGDEERRKRIIGCT